MRLNPEIIDFFKSELNQLFDNYELYLFGSRTDDRKRGGDIDLLILADRRLHLKEKLQLKAKFYFKFGDQKIDIVSFTFEENDPFKHYILDYAIKLTENKAADTTTSEQSK